MKFALQRTVPKAFFLLAAAAASACTGFQPASPSGTSNQSAAVLAPAPADLTPYFETLGQLAPGDATRQAAALASALAAVQQNPTSGNRLRYAIALGSAGHAGSNPVEGRRLISELLAGQNDLQPQEITLANAYLREFDARVALYAELARQREETERKLLTADADGDRRYNALNAETQRLKKALAEAERKLEAVAEMERALTPESQ